VPRATHKGMRSGGIASYRRLLSVAGQAASALVTLSEILSSSSRLVLPFARPTSAQSQRSENQARFSVHESGHGERPLSNARGNLDGSADSGGP
jgi:hypothetical protein